MGKFKKIQTIINLGLIDFACQNKENIKKIMMSNNNANIEKLINDLITGSLENTKKLLFNEKLQIKYLLPGRTIMFERIRKMSGIPSGTAFTDKDFYPAAITSTVIPYITDVIYIADTKTDFLVDRYYQEDYNLNKLINTDLDKEIFGIQSKLYKSYYNHACSFERKTKIPYQVILTSSSSLLCCCIILIYLMMG